MSSKRIAIIGAGPIGLEAALYGSLLGHDVQLYERGTVADNVRRWGFVRLFSPWKMNRSALGAAQLPVESPARTDPETCPTGIEFVEQYLLPLSQASPLRGRVHERTPVAGIGRNGIFKSDMLGEKRGGHVYRLLLGLPGDERIAEADVVIDASGTYGHTNWMGNGNLPALGERGLSSRFDYILRDIEGADRERFEGRRVLLVGNGYSAATALCSLARLPGTEVDWIVHTTATKPIVPIDDDPLPGRAEITRAANALAGGNRSNLRCHRGASLDAVRAEGQAFQVTLGGATPPVSLEVDRLLALVGYRPDNSLYRELQIHECYATQGPMQLASALLANRSVDCLTQTSSGPEMLRNPEPDFYILGAKSYGRNSRFLIRMGLEQVREVYTLIERQPDLNLYAA